VSASASFGLVAARPGSTYACTHFNASCLACGQATSISVTPAAPLTPFFMLPLRYWTAPARPLSNHSTAGRVWMWTVRLTSTPHTHTRLHQFELPASAYVFSAARMGHKPHRFAARQHLRERAFPCFTNCVLVSPQVGCCQRLQQHENSRRRRCCGGWHQRRHQASASGRCWRSRRRMTESHRRTPSTYRAAPLVSPASVHLGLLCLHVHDLHDLPASACALALRAHATRLVVALPCSTCTRAHFYACCVACLW
jgi:hypothetical protein